MLLLSFLFLFAIGGIVYMWFASKKKPISKKFAIPFLIFSVIIIFIGSNADHAQLTNALENERKENEQILLEKNLLEETIETLEVKVDELEGNVSELH